VLLFGMKKFCLTVVVVAALAVYGAAQPNQKPSYSELFDSVWQTINDNFYDPAFGGADWKAIRQKYAPQVAP
jgi:carboxyl-terminal processing protease